MKIVLANRNFIALVYGLMLTTGALATPAVGQVSVSGVASTPQESGSVIATPNSGTARAPQQNARGGMMGAERSGASPGMGAMGGGMGGGMGGMGGGMMMPGGFGYPTQPPPPLVTWTKPNGDKPQWLITGSTALQANEDLRQKLETASQLDLTDSPLTVALTELQAKSMIVYSLNQAALKEQSIDPEVPVNISGKGPIRELLRRILSPLGLTYIVCEDYIEITTADEALSRPVLRTYDLAHVMSDNQSLNELLNCIQNNIAPEYWESGDSSLGSIGSLLIVRATEEVHYEISKLLASVAVATPGTSQAGGQSAGGQSMVAPKLFSTQPPPTPIARPTVPPGVLPPGSVPPLTTAPVK